MVDRVSNFVDNMDISRMMAVHYSYFRQHGGLKENIEISNDKIPCDHKSTDSSIEYDDQELQEKNPVSLKTHIISLAFIFGLSFLTPSCA